MTRYLLVVAMLGVPLTVQAQEPSPVPRGLDLQALPTGYVLDDQGVETSGRLLKLDRDGVVLVIDGAERRFDLARVKRVSRRGDSLKNGAIAGAVVGVVMGLLTGGIADCRTDSGYGTCGAGQRVGFVVGGTAIYTAIGVGIDALIQGRTTIYQAPPRGGSLSFTLRW